MKDFKTFYFESLSPSITYDDKDDYITINASLGSDIIGYVTAQSIDDGYIYFEDMMDEEAFYDTFPSGNFLRIESLEIKDYYKGTGYGKLLMKTIIQYAKDHEFDTIYLNASPMGNSGLPISELVNFYKSSGFSDIPNVEQYPNNREMIMYLK